MWNSEKTKWILYDWTKSETQNELKHLTKKSKFKN